MRAKFVKPYSKAYVFDFDDVLAKTKAKVKIIRNNKHIHSLSTKQFSNYEMHKNDELDLSDFRNPLFIKTAKRYKMWFLLTLLQKYNETNIFILTARQPDNKDAIYNFFLENGIDIINYDNIFTVGGGTKTIIGERKKEILEQIKNNYDIVYFYDDDKNNIENAKLVSGIITKLVENKII